MSADEKALVYRTAWSVISAENPEGLAELEDGFEHLYGSLELTSDRGTDPQRGLSFDLPSLGLTAVSAVVWIAACVIREALQQPSGRPRSRALRNLEPLLSERTADPLLVDAVLRHVERLAGEVDELREVLAHRRTAGVGPRAERSGLGAAALAQTPAEGFAQLVPDLEISIGLAWHGHERRIEYFLSAIDPSLELNKEPFVSEPLRSEPRAYLAELFGAVESLRLDSADDREIAVLKMESKGADLFQKLIPRDLQRKLWSLRDRVATVLLQTDEETTSIPWELLKLRDVDSASADGPFLCEAFELARWLPRVPWVTRFPLARPALVTPASSGLKSASRERDDLRDLLGRHGRVAENVQAQFRVLRRHLTSGLHGSWHFTGHGLARENRDADQWQLGLDSKEPLRPEDLHAGVLRAAKPLVFLNACQTGRHGLSLTAVGGWSSRFLAAGAGAFVGCHWSVPDDRAAELAIDFYRRLLEGAPLGRAMREARLELRRRHSGDPTWLAYTLFAHPLASVSSEAEPVAARRRPAAAPSGQTSRRAGSASARPSTREPAAPAPPEEAPSPPTPAAPGPRAGEEQVHEPDGTVLLYVPGGEYTIGNEDLEWSRPAHRVLLSPYWIGKHPVTNRQYARFLEASPDQPRPESWDDPRFNQPEQPVVGVSWHEAVAYCRWASVAADRGAVGGRRSRHRRAPLPLGRLVARRSARQLRKPGGRAGPGRRLSGRKGALRQPGPGGQRLGVVPRRLGAQPLPGPGGPHAGSRRQGRSIGPPRSRGIVGQPFGRPDLRAAQSEHRQAAGQRPGVSVCPGSSLSESPQLLQNFQAVALT